MRKKKCTKIFSYTSNHYIIVRSENMKCSTEVALPGQPGQRPRCCRCAYTADTARPSTRPPAPRPRLRSTNHWVPRRESVGIQCAHTATGTKNSGVSVTVKGSIMATVTRSGRCYGVHNNHARASRPNVPGFVPTGLIEAIVHPLEHGDPPPHGH